jgi:hypothetical protein
MSAMLQSAFTSVTSWLGGDQGDEDRDYKFYCDCEKLIELIVEKAQQKDNCVNIEQKDEEVETSPRHNKCPHPMIMKTSKVTPPQPEGENALTERLLRDRAESGELGVRVGDGVLSLQLITDATEGTELLIKRVNDASAATLRTLGEIPEYCSCILAVCFNATKEDLDKLEGAVHGPVFCWKIGPLQDMLEARTDAKNELTDQDFEAFLAIARATVVLHVIQEAGF